MTSVHVVGGGYEDPTTKFPRRVVKDDTFTTLRSRHPTDRGGAPHGGHHFLNPEPNKGEHRTRALSANAQVIGGDRRINVYRRNPLPGDSTSTAISTTPDKNLLSPSSIDHNRSSSVNHSESCGDEPTSFKRLNLFQRSFKSSECKVSPEPLSSSSNKSHYNGGHSPKHHVNSSANATSDSPRSPFKLNLGLLDLFRHRSNSEGGSKQQHQHQRSTGKSPSSSITVVNDNNNGTNSRIRVMRRLDPLFIDTTTNAANVNQQKHSPKLSSMKSSSMYAEGEEYYDDDDQFCTSPVMRKRSNSDNNYGVNELKFTYCTYKKFTRNSHQLLCKKSVRNLINFCICKKSSLLRNLFHQLFTLSEFKKNMFPFCS